jgi:hypothetical protein
MTDHQQFIVIRHGESETNATNTFQAGNQYDSDPLTTLGQEDAQRLAERLAELPVDVIVSSSYLRARSTAGAIAEATGATHLVPVWKDSSWVDLPVEDPEVQDHVSLLREIDVPSELQDCRSTILERGRSSTLPWRSPTSLTSITPMKKTSTTCGDEPRRCAATWRPERNG